MSSDYDNNLYSYYVSDESTVEFIGDWADNGSWETWGYHLTDTEKYFKFPFTLNNNFQDSFHGTSFDMSGSGLHTFQGIREVEADGFGTLILPTQVFTNCLRIKSTRQYSDSSLVFGVRENVQLTYTWFQLSTNGPILEIQTDTSFYNIVAKYYYDNPLVNLGEETKTDNTVNVYPNPFSNSINVKFSQPNNKNVLITLRDFQGKVIFIDTKIKLNNLYTQTFFPENLPIGVYFLDINVNGVWTTKKLIKN
jgi:hypothetical protein